MMSEFNLHQEIFEPFLVSGFRRSEMTFLETFQVIFWVTLQLARLSFDR